MKNLFLTLALGLFLSACSSTPKVVGPKIEQYPLDLDKIETVDDVRLILKLVLPENLVLNVREDSQKDSETLSSVDHLLKDKPLTRKP